MRKHIRTGFHYLVALILIIVGLLGFVLPIIPGLVFLALGVLVLSFEIPAVEKYLDNTIKENSSFGKIYYPIKDKFEKHFR